MDYDVYRMKMVDTNTCPLDAFICFNTQEDRSYNALKKLHKNKAVSNALILSFDKDESTATPHDIQVATVTIGCDLSENLVPCLKQLNTYICEKNTVGIDISCMPIPVIAQILHFFRVKHKDVSITVFYTEPKHYALYNLFDYSAYGGEIDIKTVPGFEGLTSQADDVRRVLFYIMGFEMTYLSRLIPQDVITPA